MAAAINASPRRRHASFAPRHERGDARSRGTLAPDRPRLGGLTTCWRICRGPFADLSGEGARLFGGRWNSPGRPVVYTAETAALAVLEVRVHLDLDWDLLPDDYVLMAIDLGSIGAEEIADIPSDPRAVGDAWIASGRSALLRVPSSIVPESSNFLINPRHPDASAIMTRTIRSFVFDSRLWTPVR